MLSNRFKDPILRKQFDAMVIKHRTRHSELFTPDGEPHMAAFGAMAFWHGYRGLTIGTGFVTRKERSTPAYACWRAGQYCQSLETQ